MNSNRFQAGGALTDEANALYIERKADHDALIHLQSMDYLLVIEPRQQGKTSLVNRLMYQSISDKMILLYVDVTTPDHSTEETWYRTLCFRILRQLRHLIPDNQWPAIPQNSAEWRDFLSDIARFAADAHQRLIITLDEIGAVTFPGVTTFFSVLRDIYNSRQAEPEFRHLTFWLVGAFRPQDLIKDDKISPFNIAQRVRLPDFTSNQVYGLVCKEDWPDERASAIAKRIYYWTNGQPYLTQLVCSYLELDSSPTDVDIGVEHLRREDENHLPPLFDRLTADTKLSKYVKKILAGERIKSYPSVHRRQAQLELLGLIKVDSEGYCVIRNRIYEQLLREIMGVSKNQTSLRQSISGRPIMDNRFDLIDEQGKLQSLLKKYRNNLFQLEEQKAMYGIGAPLHILNGIDEFEEKIEQLKTRLQEIEVKLESLPDEPEPQAAVPKPSPPVFEIDEADLSDGLDKQDLTALKEALERRSLALFIGADLPQPVTGLPSQAELARELARRKGLDESLSLAEVAQRVGQGGNRFEFIDFLRGQLDTIGHPPQPFHQQVAALVKRYQVEMLITTTYDNLLEMTFHQTGLGFNRVVRGSDINFINPDRPTFIRLYGDALQPDTLVVTDQDHTNLLRDRDKESIIDEVKRAFRRNTLLFLGYNLADPDFRFLFDQIAESRFARTAYAVWPGLPEADVRMWRDRGIVILAANPLPVLV